MDGTTYKCYQIYRSKRTLVDCTDVCGNTIRFKTFMFHSGFIIIGLTFLVFVRPIVISCIKRFCCIREVMERTDAETTNDASIQCDIEPAICRIIVHPDESLNITNL